jgi:hypothetical protein
MRLCLFPYTILFQLVRRMRGQEKMRVPDTIIKFFPEMGKFADRIDVSPLGDLFGG